MLSFPPMPASKDRPVYTSLSTHPSSPSSHPFPPISPSSLSSSKQPLYKRSPALFISGALALILFTAALVAVERRPHALNNDTAHALNNDTAHALNNDTALVVETPSNEDKARLKVCDPHDLPGILHIADNIDSIQGALETKWQPINPADCPAQSYVNRVASLNSTSIPSALYNRTILLIGDSIDRANAQYTCHILKGDYSITKPGDAYWPQVDISNDPNVGGWKPNSYSERSFPTICHVKSIDLMIMNVFHFSLDKEDYFTWKDQYGPPYITEDRIEEIALPLIARIDRDIDILEFSSGLWDLARFGRQDDSLLTAESTTTVRHLTLDRLQWFSTRFEQVLHQLSNALPISEVAQHYVLHLHTSSDNDAGNFQQWWQVAGGGKDGNKHTYYFPSWRINEINNALKEAVNHHNAQSSAKAAWKIDNWGHKLAGMELFEKGNVHPHYAAITLWLEQMFYRLVNGS